MTKLTDPEYIAVRDALAQRFRDMVEHFSVMTPEAVYAEASSAIHIALNNLQVRGLIPRRVNLDEIRVRVSTKDPTKFTVLLPRELSDVVEDARVAACGAKHRSAWEMAADASMEHDAPREAPYGWIQWKGTNVCIDLHCRCGHHGHVDDEFFYFYKCAGCGTRYAVGSVVRLIELSDAEAAGAEDGVGFKSGG